MAVAVAVEVARAWQGVLRECEGEMQHTSGSNTPRCGGVAMAVAAVVVWRARRRWQRTCMWKAHAAVQAAAATDAGRSGAPTAPLLATTRTHCMLHTCTGGALHAGVVVPSNTPGGGCGARDFVRWVMAGEKAGERGQSSTFVGRAGKNGCFSKYKKHRYAHSMAKYS